MQLRKLILSNVLWRGLYFFTVLLLNIAIAQVLGAKYAGIIFYIINFLSLVLLIASCSLESGMSYFVSQKKITESKLAGLATIWSTVILVTVVVVYVSTNPDFESIYAQQYLFIAATYVFGLLLNTFFTALFSAQRNYFLPNIIMSVANIIAIALGWLLEKMYGGGDNHLYFLYVYFLNFPIQGLVLMIFYFKNNKLSIKLQLPSKEELLMLFRYSLFSLIGNCVFFLLYRIDYWFIQNNSADYYPATELPAYLGNYIQASKIGQMFLVLPAILATVVFPGTAAGNGLQITKSLPHILKGLIVVYFFIMALLIAFGSWIYPFLFGPTFNKMYIPFLLMMPGILALAVSTLLGAYNAGKHKVGLNVKAAFWGLIAIVLGDWIFIPKFGINAAALVSSAGYITYMLLLVKGFSVDEPMGLRKLLVPTWHDFKKLLSVTFRSK